MVPISTPAAVPGPVRCASREPSAKKSNSKARSGAFGSGGSGEPRPFAVNLPGQQRPELAASVAVEMKSVSIVNNTDGQGIGGLHS